jgi:hypothetical protein
LNFQGGNAGSNPAGDASQFGGCGKWPLFILLIVPLPENLDGSPEILKLQMRIPLHHPTVFVTKKLMHHVHVIPQLHGIRCKVMPEVVEPEIHDPCSLALSLILTPLLAMPKEGASRN